MARYLMTVQKGENIGGPLPATSIATRTQSIDVLEVYHRLLTEDDELFLFVIKVLHFMSWVKGSIRRCVNTLRQVWPTDDQESETDLDVCEEMQLELRSASTKELKPFHLDSSVRFNWFGVILSHYYDQQFRHATTEAPSQAEALHGATCGNYFCTYLI